MRRIPVYLICTLVLVDLSVAGVGIQQAMMGNASEASRATMTEAGADPVPWLPPFEGPRAPAMPAIRPSTAPVGRSTATFTAQDVEEYFRVHGLSGSVRIQAAGPITVEKVDFLSGSEVAARLNRGINQPDDVLLCLATLRGSFGVEGPSEALAYNSSTACVLFDAQTGNTLVFGLGQ